MRLAITISAGDAIRSWRLRSNMGLAFPGRLPPGPFAATEGTRHACHDHPCRHRRLSQGEEIHPPPVPEVRRGPGRWLPGAVAQRRAARATSCAVTVAGGGPEGVRVRDLGSRNGTYVNGTIIGQRHPNVRPDEATGLYFPAANCGRETRSRWATPCSAWAPPMKTRRPRPCRQCWWKPSHR